MEVLAPHQEAEKMKEAYTARELDIEAVAPEGLGYGKGSISVKNRRESGDLPKETEETVKKEVRNPERHVVVEFNDDGCGDGRYTRRLYVLEMKKSDMCETSLNRSGLRAKIFGGGLIVGWIADRAISGPVTEQDTVTSDRRTVADKLTKNNIKFGGHTSDHAPDGKTGCGAIDHAPEIVRSAVEFAAQIRENITYLRPDIYSEERFAKVIDVFRSMAESSAYFGDGSIEDTKRIFAESKAVIKELQGDHAEIRFVRNEVPGTTINQSKIVEITNDIGEIFVDDSWRRDMYADALGKGSEEDAAVAALATEVWTLAVAATLTDGSLPVDRIRLKVSESGLSDEDDPLAA